MSLRVRPKPFKWEYIPERGPGREYRIGDAHDDVVTDFGTEQEAEEYVKQANLRKE